MRSASTGIFRFSTKGFDDDDSPRARRCGAGRLAAAGSWRARESSRPRTRRSPAEMLAQRATGREPSIAQVYRALPGAAARDERDGLQRPAICRPATVPATSRGRSSDGSGAPRICWSTSTRTPTACSICWCRRWRRDREICAWSATRTNRSIVGAAPTSATSWISSATTRTRKFSSSSKITARPKRSWPRPARVIRNNTERKVKNLWTENAAGEPVTYYTGVTERDEADFIAREIARLTARTALGPPTSSSSTASTRSRG